ncbi:hypothetical protein M885DRAFT_625549 [Pelagophyceae sp. CCMP2097]|nr:hypothetical protein M885DRAFT_625549 [Pelagophyceae sp. CCMP2097]
MVPRALMLLLLAAPVRCWVAPRAAPRAPAAPRAGPARRPRAAPRGGRPAPLDARRRPGPAPLDARRRGDSAAEVPPFEPSLDDEPDEAALATLALCAVAVLWGTNFPAVRYLVSEPTFLAPATYAAARFGVAAVVVTPLLAKASGRGALLAGAECGCWIAAGYVAQCLALQSTTAAKGALLCALQVVVVPAIVAAVPRLAAPDAGDSASRARRQNVERTCALVALSGAALLEARGLSPPTRGDAVAALQPFFFGISYLRISSAAKEFPSEGDSLAMSAMQVLTVAAVAAAWFGATEAGHGGIDSLWRLAQDATAVRVVVWTAVASTAVTIVLQTYALKRVSAAAASLITSSEPLWAAILAAALLGENRYGAADYAGGALILLASVGPQLVGAVSAAPNGHADAPLDAENARALRGGAGHAPDETARRRRGAADGD